MEYKLNEKNIIRYKNNVANGLYYLVVKSNKINVYSEHDELVWSKTFKTNILKVKSRIGNFSSVDEQIVITMESKEEFVYSTSGKLLYDRNEEINLDNYYEDIKSRVLYSADLCSGYYQVSCNLLGVKDKIELFDSRGTCVYEGQKRQAFFKTIVYENEVFQIRTRDGIEVKNVKVKKIAREPTIHVIGDSTLTNQDLPFWGWPQLLQARTNIPVINYAISARSTKSFIEEGRIELMERNIKTGDFLIIGFGHNDEKNNYFGTAPQEYCDNLKNFVVKYQRYGLKVIIVTPIARRHFKGESLVETHSPYVDLMRQQFTKYLIDNNKYTKSLIKYLGKEQSKKVFVHSDLMKIYDDTHTSYYGASKICNNFILDFSKYLK